MLEGRILSKEGHALLNTPYLYRLLQKIAATVGVTPEEYLLRFEAVLRTDPESIMKIFEY